MLNELYKGIIIGSVISGLIAFIVGFYLYSTVAAEFSQTVSDLIPLPSDSKRQEEEKNNIPSDELIYFPPIYNFKGRITKKSFGDYITPENSPIQQERFSGYHTGIDLEVFTEEKDKDVQVFAFCNGNIIEKKYVTGYGGVLVQKCEIEEGTVTVLYGHLNLQSIKEERGEKLRKGDLVGNLGKAFSSETDGERKHLHFGIHKGEKVELKGYVQKKEELQEWLNPLSYLNR